MDAIFTVLVEQLQDRSFNKLRKRYILFVKAYGAYMMADSFLGQSRFFWKYHLIVAVRRHAERIGTLVTLTLQPVIVFIMRIRAVCKRAYMRQRCYRCGLLVPAADLSTNTFLKTRCRCCRCRNGHPVAVCMANVGVVGASAGLIGAGIPVRNAVMRHHGEVVRMRCGKLGNALLLPC